ncbi:MAG: ribonuclease D [Solirubrobacteraceae bacterium]
MIASNQRIQQIAEDARAARTIAIDTEFVGEGRYRTLLCLIQIAVPVSDPTTSRLRDAERIDLVDPLLDDVELAPLAAVLADPEIQIVLHAGRQDVALLRRVLHTDVSNVFDTQLAAGFAGYAAQRAYDSLLSQVLGVRLAKSASFTRWDRRPLTPEQLSYACEDVEHLLRLSAALQDRLQALGRLHWALQECELIAAASDARDLDTILARLPRLGSAPPLAHAVARELTQWRERTAERQDRPVQSVLTDAALVEIAKRRPEGINELTAIRGVPQSIARRAGAEIVETVRRGERSPPEPRRAHQRTPPPEARDAPLVALVEALARARAAEAGLAYELIAARSDLQAIVAARRAGAEPPDVRALRGWRRQLAGEQILSLLDGELTLSARDGSIRIDALDALDAQPEG